MTKICEWYEQLYCWIEEQYYTWRFPREAFWHSKLGKRLCNRLGHTDVWWISTNGYEPDMHCKRCDMDLG